MWVKVDGEITVREMMKLVKKGKGMAIVRKVIRRGEKPIEFWVKVE
jgi:hypothetical protein